MKKDGKIFVAGHRGLVGSAIVRRLKAAGYENIITKTHRELDLTRQGQVEEFFDYIAPDYVFLAAAKVGGIVANNTLKAEFIYENLMIASNVIHCSYKTGVKKLLNLGSSCIYPKYAPQPLKEEYLMSGYLEPTNEPYAIAKISAIKLCRYYNEQYGTNFISVMPTNLYGPNDNFDLISSHVLPALIRKFHLAKLLRQGSMADIRKDFYVYGVPFEKRVDEMTDDDISLFLSEMGITSDSVKLWGSGAAYREFLFSEDLADAVVFIMERYNASDVGELVNIGVGKDLQIKDLANLIKKCTGYNGNISWNSAMPDGTPRKLLDVSKMSALGWTARTKLLTGIKKTYKYYLSNIE